MTKTVLDEIKHALMAANAVQGEQEFCVAWLGKNASYMRVLRFQQLQPSADALAVCASKLNYYTADDWKAAVTASTSNGRNALQCCTANAQRH